MNVTETAEKPRPEKKPGRVMNRITTARYIGVSKEYFRIYYLADPDFKKLERVFGRGQGHKGFLREDVDAYLRNCPSVESKA